MSLAAVPEAIDPGEVRKFLGEQPGVSKIHDLHIWPISTTTTALTCHLVMPGGHPGDEFLQGVTAELEHKFAIHHPTLQIEVSELTACRLAPDDVI
jgi:cobalt-zinc-cadmium efflux system protein